MEEHKPFEKKEELGQSLQALEEEAFRFEENSALVRDSWMDTETKNFVRSVPNAVFSFVSPTPLSKPSLVSRSQDALSLIGLENASDKFLETYFSGNVLVEGSRPISHCYCGYQFGYFSGQLGDGAAILLGQTPGRSPVESGSQDDAESGHKRPWEVQLKGAGKTPFSRSADGRKVLRSSIREFLCSEAMHALHIPTTRAATIITSEDYVVRDKFYTGNPIRERCTVVSRLAESFIRFGSFEIFKDTDPVTGRSGPSPGNNTLKKELLDFCVERYFPEAYASSDEDHTRYLEMYKEVVTRTARLVALWQCVGFCHGVLNTDNMSILGLTIDYGPFGFMDHMNLDHICNTSDDSGRYSYQKQPEICYWNCERFADVFLSLAPSLTSTSSSSSSSSSSPFHSALSSLFWPTFKATYYQQMSMKLGLTSSLPEDHDIIDSFVTTLDKTRADFTNCFRKLSSAVVPKEESVEFQNEEVLKYILSQRCSYEQYKKDKTPPALDSHLLSYCKGIAEKMGKEKARMVLQSLGMNKALLDVVFKEETNEDEDDKEIATPEERDEHDTKLWRDWLQVYEGRLYKEWKLHCKKGTEEERDNSHQAFQTERLQSMNSVNPKFILRNFVAEHAIRSAEQGDYEEVTRVLEYARHPFAEKEYQLKGGLDASSSLPTAPSWASCLKVSCSS